MSLYKIRKDYINNEVVGEVIIRYNENETVTSFTTDPANTDYQAYLTWVAEGNEAEEWSAE